MKKGFTLVEVIGIIAILSIITAISVPVVIKSIEHKKSEQYDNIIEDLILATQTYIQIEDITDTKINIETLQEKGYANKNLINPNTNEAMTGCIVIEIVNGYNNYKYTETCE